MDADFRRSEDARVAGPRGSAADGEKCPSERCGKDVKGRRAAATTPYSSKDPSAHAEIQALREASTALGNYRSKDARAFTLEPCAMCAGAIMHARNREARLTRTPIPRPVACGRVSDLFSERNSITTPTVTGGVLADERGGCCRNSSRRGAVTKIEISIPEQSLALLENGREARRYAVSTSRNGPGERQELLHPERRPHRAGKKCGAGQPWNTVFVRAARRGRCDLGLAERFPGQRLDPHAHPVAVGWSREESAGGGGHHAALHLHPRQPGKRGDGEPGSIGCIRCATRISRSFSSSCRGDRG